MSVNIMENLHASHVKTEEEKKDDETAQTALENMKKKRKADSTFKLTNDTYAMAYKALNMKVCEEINLDK